MAGASDIAKRMAPVDAHKLTGQAHSSRLMGPAHEHELMGPAREQMFMGPAHEHELMGPTLEHLLRGLDGALSIFCLCHHFLYPPKSVTCYTLW